MARVSYPKRDQYPSTYLDAYDRMLSERGETNIFLALANIPNLLDPLLSFTREMREGAAIDARLRELAIMTVGLTAGVSYEFNHHWNSALAAGVRREQLEQLEQLVEADSSDAFDDTERAIVRYAREATLSLKVSDETWCALRRHLTEREAMDVVMAVAWYNAVARMILPLEVEMEDWYVRR